MGKIWTVVLNSTDNEVDFRLNNAGVMRELRIIRPRERCKLEFDSNAMYQEYIFGGGQGRALVSRDDCMEWKSIELVTRADDSTRFEWKGIKRRGYLTRADDRTRLELVIHPRASRPQMKFYVNDEALYLAAWKDASEKLEDVASLSVRLEKDLDRVVIYRAQCENLVTFCSKRLQRIKEIFSLISDVQMRRLFQSRKLQQLAKSSDNLLRALLSAQMLLKGCGKKEWRRAALVLSLPPPDPQNLEKYSGSKFAHVIRELGWSFDLVQYSLGEDEAVADLILNWDDGRDRYVFQGNQLKLGVANDEMELLQGDIDRETRDREDLLRDLKNGFLRKENLSISVARRLCCTSPHETFAATVQNRCQNQFFDMNELDLRKKIRISKGRDKKVYRGEWLGLEVAIATIKNTPRVAVEREAGFMVRVHHPNVVDFFGCAFKKEEGEEGGAAQEDQWTAFLVMELMEEDLGHLIATIAKDPLATGQSNSGGPFSLPVIVDILVQIVEAMIHSHKHQVMHRDLKPGNCLVSKKVGPRSNVDVHYTVKVIDFGISKLWESETDIHTRRRGTVQYMAPEVWDGGEYTWSADVYSFGMVCYEVITGFKPLASPPFYQCKSIEEKFDLLRGGERPRIPGTCPESLSILMKKCWAATPEDRPTFQAIRKDLWVFKLPLEAQITIQA